VYKSDIVDVQIPQPDSVVPGTRGQPPVGQHAQRGDLQDIVRAVRARGAALKATEQSIDTGTATGKCFLDMLGVFAEFETNLAPPCIAAASPAIGVSSDPRVPAFATDIAT
jgi:hypothetical protein